MYTKSSTTIWMDIWLHFLIFCLTLSTCYGFKINIYETSTINQGDDPSESEALLWWQIVIIVVLPLVAGVLVFVITMFVIQTCLKVLEAKANAQANDENSVPYDRPFHPRELDDSPRPRGAEFYNRGSSLQEGFMAQLAAGRQRLRRNQIATEIQLRPVTANERPPEQFIRSVNGTIDDPPPYDAAVVEQGAVVHPRRFSLETTSFDSDISIIESPPSYFTVQESFPTTRS